MRLVKEAVSQEASLSWNAAVIRIGHRTGVNPETLRGGVKQARVDTGEVRDVTTDAHARMKDPEREVRELKRANEILLAASSFFAQELDPRLPF